MNSVLFFIRLFQFLNTKKTIHFLKSCNLLITVMQKCWTYPTPMVFIDPSSFLKVSTTSHFDPQPVQRQSTVSWFSSGQKPLWIHENGPLISLLLNHQALPRSNISHELRLQQMHYWMVSKTVHARQLAAIGKTTCLYQAITISLLQASSDSHHNSVSTLCRYFMWCYLVVANRQSAI